jgi:hypothetical protein
VVRGARRAETAFEWLLLANGRCRNGVEALKEIPPWQTFDLAKEQDMKALAKAFHLNLCWKLNVKPHTAKVESENSLAPLAARPWAWGFE